MVMPEDGLFDKRGERVSEAEVGIRRERGRRERQVPRVMRGLKGVWEERRTESVD